MFLSKASIRRPVAMGCLIIALALLGLNSWRKMSLEYMPKMDAPFITVVTVYPGASPGEIETDIARRIEDVVVSIDGLKHVSSSCMENVCMTMLEFEMSINVDIAATDVREKIDLVRADFPPGTEDPKIQKFDINAKPIITLALTGEAPLDALYDYADHDMKDQLGTIPGVAEVELVGGAKREIHVQINRDELQSRGLTTLSVVEAIRNGIRTIPSGRIRDRGTEYSVKFDADFRSVRDIGSLEIIDGCRISDVAQVEMATEELRQRASLDSRPCISIRIVKKADANSVDVTRRVRAALADLEQTLPGGMELVWVTDDGRFTEATVESAWTDVFYGVLLTAGILFLFLYDARTLFVVSVTMPLTIIIGLFFMQRAGFSLNASTLMAVGMSVGILVANSIVVIEAISRRLSDGMPPKEAASLGVGDTVLAVLASAGTNTVVLFPLSIMSGKISMFIRPLALTMVIMTVVSLFISFTLTPMLCSLLLKPRDAARRSLLYRMESGWNRVLGLVVAGYQRLLVLFERSRILALLLMGIVAAMLVHSLSLAKAVGFNLVTESDRGEVYVKVEFPTRYDMETTWKRMKGVEARLSGLPELRHSLLSVGKVEGMLGQSSEGVYLAQMLLKFSERDEREISLDEVMERIRSRLSDIPEAILAVSKPSAIGGQSVPVEMEITGPELATLDRLVDRAASMARDLPGLIDVDTTVRIGKPELRIRPKRPVLADRTIPAVSMGMALRGNLEGLTAGTYKEKARNYDIVVLMEKREGKEQVGQFQFPGVPGNPVLLETLSSMTESVAPIQIIRKNKQRVSKLFSNLDGNTPLGTATDRISDALRSRGNLPPGYDFRYAGMHEVMQEAQESFAEVLLIAIVLVVLSLAAILESFRQPVFILVTLPLAVIGVMWFLYVAGLSMDIFVIMGCVMMVGIVVNNAILIMDRFNVLKGEGVPRHAAMIDAAGARFRPVLMTTVAAVLGMLPMAVSAGIGAELRNGMGVAAVGGILVSGLLTMLLLPILYNLFTRRDRNA